MENVLRDLKKSDPTFPGDDEAGSDVKTRLGLSVNLASKVGHSRHPRSRQQCI